MGYVDASRQMAKLTREFQCGDTARYTKEADAVGNAIDIMKDPNGPLWLAATVDNAFPDVWGSAYLVMLNLSTADRQQAAMHELVASKASYFRNGQVRNLPYPLYWDRCCWTPGCKQKVGSAGC